MATVKGVNKTLADNPVRDNITDAGLLEGKLRVMVDSYEADSAAVDTIIEMGKEIPKGARVLEIILTTNDLGTDVDLTVGDYETPARYISVTSCETDNQVTRMNVEDGRQYEVDETTATETGTDRQIIVTVAVGTATGTIKLEVIYTYE